MLNLASKYLGMVFVVGLWSVSEAGRWYTSNQASGSTDLMGIIPQHCGPKKMALVRQALCSLWCKFTDSVLSPRTEKHSNHLEEILFGCAGFWLHQAGSLVVVCGCSSLTRLNLGPCIGMMES